MIRIKCLQYDGWLFAAVLLLLGMGLLMVASASMVISDQHFGHPFHFFFRQSVYILLAAVVMAVVVQVEMRTWQEYGVYLLLLGIGLLVCVLIPGVGHVVNGSRRWLNLGILRVQVSEVVKLLVIIYLASYLVRHAEAVRYQVMGLVKPILLLGVIGVLLLMEPDFGAVTVITMVTLGLLFLGGVQLRHFMCLLVTTVLVLGLVAVSAPYRLHRLTAFLNPWEHQFESGYQLTQALIALGRGGVVGVGLGRSVQKLFYLPEAYTDFLFAVLGEELGLVGLIFVALLFAVLVWRAFCIGHRAFKNTAHFSAYVAYGLGLWLGLQAMVNMGVNMGVLPTKGLTLPLMSYGGSSLLVNAVVVGILFRIYHEQAVCT